MVGQEQIGAAGLELLDAGVGHTVGCALDGVVDIELDLVLQRCNRGDTGKLSAQPMSYKWFEHPAQGAGKAREAKVGEDI
ncbi:hypothetical protein D3C84_1116720 [compost metagenome]